MFLSGWWKGRKNEKKIEPPRAPSSPRKATARIGVKTKESIFVFVLLGALVPIFHKPDYGNRYYTDLFKSFIEGRHGVLGG
jgi:hypothetical protein